MVRKIAIGLLCLAMVGFGACIPVPRGGDYPVKVTPVLPVTLTEAPTAYDLAFKAESGLWLSDSSVLFEGLRPGLSNSRIFEVGNMDKAAKEIRLSIVPTNDKDLKGWVQLPSQYYNWFSIDKTEFTLHPGESQQIVVTITVPDDADYSGKMARCMLLALGWTVISPGLVSNVPMGVASEWYIETE